MAIHEDQVVIDRLRALGIKLSCISRYFSILSLSGMRPVSFTVVLLLVSLDGCGYERFRRATTVSGRSATDLRTLSSTERPSVLPQTTTTYNATSQAHIGFNHVRIIPSKCEGCSSLKDFNKSNNHSEELLYSKHLIKRCSWSERNCVCLEGLVKLDGYCLLPRSMTCVHREEKVNELIPFRRKVCGYNKKFGININIFFIDECYGEVIFSRVDQKVHSRFTYNVKNGLMKAGLKDIASNDLMLLRIVDKDLLLLEDVHLSTKFCT